MKIRDILDVINGKLLYGDLDKDYQLSRAVDLVKALGIYSQK